MQERLSIGWRRLVASSLSLTLSALAIISVNIISANAQDVVVKDRTEARKYKTDTVLQPETTSSAQPSVTFTNPTAITIPATIGAGNPYPSNIAVTGVTGTVTKVTATLNGYSHSWPDDVGVLLVGPTGVKVRLVIDAGADNEITNVNITFDDAAANPLPDNPTTPIVSGTYRPTSGTTAMGLGNPHPANFPAPAPAGPYQTTLASFNNLDPNGTWSLYVDDDSVEDNGVISGGWTLDITTSAPPVAVKPCFDFFGSGRTSFATVTSDGFQQIWRLQNNGGAGSETVFFGAPTDILTPGYFDADNRTDINVWRPGASAGAASFYYLRPSTAPSSILGIQWGANGDVARREADYDGDGRDDPTVARNVGGTITWYYLRSSNSTIAAVSFGAAATDIPLVGADYAGDGRAEITVLRQSAAGQPDTYLIGDSNSGALLLSQGWGEFDTDFYVIGDYVGDAKADFAVWRGNGAAANGIWYVRENGGSGAVTTYQWGQPGVGGVRDVAVCGDYNGDSKNDIAVYRRSTATYYWINSGAAPTVGTQAIPGSTDSSLPVGALRTF